jgi:hypothetical protein
MRLCTDKPPPLPNVVGCYLESASSLLYIDYVLFMASEAGKSHLWVH